MLKPTSPRPVALSVRPEHIPQVLRILPQWVTWRYTWKPKLKKWDKPPLIAHLGTAASSTDPETWNLFGVALKAYQEQKYDGIGVVIIEDNDLVGIDLDHCRNPETGTVDAWAQVIVDRMRTYTEISPSGTGLRLFLQGKRPKKGRRKGLIEIYSWGRYLTITGWHVDGTPTTIESRQAELDAFEAELAARPSKPIPQPSTDGYRPYLSDDDLLSKALAARNGRKFARLWAGDTSDYSGDDSRADLALCSELAFWTQDERQIDRLFHRSGLYRDKWQRADYRDATIAKALAGTTQHWRAPRVDSDGADHSSNGRGREVPGEPTTMADERQARVKRLGIVRTLANEIGETAHFAQDAGEKLYRFHRGVYTPDGLAYVKRRVKTILELWGLSALWSSHRAAEVAEYLRVDAPTLWERPSREVLNLKNGLLDIETRELVDHDPAHLSAVQIPVDYNIRASCPDWESFAEQTFPKDAQDLAWEIIAWLMCPEVSIQRAILLQGVGGNGKSTYLRGVIAFLGRQNISSLSLQKLELDRFAVAGLMGKLANICPDLPSTHLQDTGMFKAITGGDYITAEYKYRESFDFLPFARLIFSANHFPRSSDDSEAFFDRWHVVPFERSFRGTPAEISREVLDTKLAHPDELSGVLNKALGVVTRLQSQGFSISDSMRQAWEEFRRTTDPMTVWLDRMTEELSYAIVAKDILLRAYNEDCDRIGRPRISAHAMTKAITRAYPQVTEGKRTVSGGLKWCWIGLGLRASGQKDEEK